MFLYHRIVCAPFCHIWCAEFQDRKILWYISMLKMPLKPTLPDAAVPSTPWVFHTPGSLNTVIFFSFTIQSRYNKIHSKYNLVWPQSISTKDKIGAQIKFVHNLSKSDKKQRQRMVVHKYIIHLNTIPAHWNTICSIQYAICIPLQYWTRTTHHWNISITFFGGAI